MSNFFTSFLTWFQTFRKPIAIAVTSTTVFVGGYQTTKIAEAKYGIVIHDQGDEIDVNNTSWDLWNKPRDFSNFIAGFTDERFNNGCSYHEIIVGDSSFKYQNYNAISYHAGGFNSPTIGVMLTRTNDKELNVKTLNKFIEVHNEIKDTLEVWENSEMLFSLFHSDVAKNGKEDPHEFREGLEELNLRYDNRPYPIGLDLE